MKFWFSVGVAVAFGIGGFAVGPSALAAEAAAAEATVRFATFNASLNRNALGSLLEDLTAGNVTAALVDYRKRYAGSSDIAGLSEQQRRVLQIHNVAEIIIGKQRHGPVGTAKLFFNQNITKFEDLIEDERLPDAEF